MSDPQIEQALEKVCDVEAELCKQYTGLTQATAIINAAKTIASEAKDILEDICDPTSGP